MVQREIALLRSQGNEVEVELWDNNNIRGLALLKTVLSPSFSSEAKKRIKSVLKKNRPDICHVHNFFPLVTPSVYEACIEEGVPVVQTLHNYRIFCANALFLRDSQPCEECLKGCSWNAVRYGCYRGSRLASIPVAQMISTHRRTDTWNRKIDQLIALTEFAQRKFIEGGIHESKISLRRNYSEDLGLGEQDGDYAIYLGRISAEKGISSLVKSWKKEYPKLLIVGDGIVPVNLLEKSNIEVLSRVERDKAIALLKKARFSILPTECYEGGTPSALIESLCVGTPILASRIGGIPEILQDGRSGFLFAPRSIPSIQLAVEKFLMLGDGEKKFSQNARTDYLRCFNADIAYLELQKIYQKVLSARI